MPINVSVQDANIFIYSKMSPSEAIAILLSKLVLLEKSTEFLPVVLKLQENGGNLWLIRESRVEGLLTVQSLSYNKDSSEWKANKPSRYMLSKNKGWITNNPDPLSNEFLSNIDKAGGVIKLTADNATPHLNGLLMLLSQDGYFAENRINPKIGQMTQTKGYSGYIDHETNTTSLGLNFNFTLFKPVSIAATSVSLPEGILIALSCPFKIMKKGEVSLMKDPVTLVKDGITYERSSLLEKYADYHLEEGKDFYPNLKIRTIINYISATSLPPQEYLAKLDKVVEDIQDPISLSEMEHPVLSPSGHSYEKDSLEKWIKKSQSIDAEIPSTWTSNHPTPDPVTREDIKGKLIVDNVNLKKFIKAWPSFYESQQSKLLVTLKQ